jgi:hypothetical protein
MSADARTLSPRDAPIRRATAHVSPITHTDAIERTNAGSHSPEGYRVSEIAWPVGQALARWNRAGTSPTILNPG